jgi:hypothetical protein
MRRQHGVVRPNQMRYVRAFTIPRTNPPAGRVLVHNHVRPVDAAGKRVPPDDLFQGRDGFRGWTQIKTRRLVRCSCGWAPRVTVHYRVNL